MSVGVHGRLSTSLLIVIYFTASQVALLIWGREYAGSSTQHIAKRVVCAEFVESTERR